MYLRLDVIYAYLETVYLWMMINSKQQVIFKCVAKKVNEKLFFSLRCSFPKKKQKKTIVHFTKKNAQTTISLQTFFEKHVLPSCFSFLLNERRLKERALPRSKHRSLKLSWKCSSEYNSISRFKTIKIYSTELASSITCSTREV